MSDAKDGLFGRAGAALVRQCDGCGMTTAADLDATREHALEMQMPGQTVREVSTEECLRLWQTAGRCRCKSPNASPSATEGRS